MSDQTPIEAGEIESLRDTLEAALRGEAESAVPCGSCTACCSASQFIHIGPDETATLAEIPRALRFSAPGLPRGHVVLPYDEDGRCPMLREGRCSIYDVRPRTCRVYDCRLYAASGLAARHEDRTIALRASRWTFRASQRGEAIREALERAVRFLETHREVLGPDRVPARVSALGPVALSVHRAFLETRGDLLVVVTPSIDEVRALLQRGISPPRGTRARARSRGRSTR